jgi:RNA recognition motif-containing protein
MDNVQLSFTGGKVYPKVMNHQMAFQQENQISSITSVFVGNLSVFCSENDLRSLLSTFGPVHDILIKYDPKTSLCAGYAFVKFSCRHDAERGIDSLQGRLFMGRALRYVIKRLSTNVEYLHVPVDLDSAIKLKKTANLAWQITFLTYSNPSLNRLLKFISATSPSKSPT